MAFLDVRRSDSSYLKVIQIFNNFIQKTRQCYEYDVGDMHCTNVNCKIVNLKNKISSLHSTKLSYFLELERYLTNFDDVDYQIPSDSFAALSDKDFSGCTLLHFAVMEKDLDSVNALLNNNADFLLRNNSSYTALHLSVECYKNILIYFQPMVKALLEAQIQSNDPENPVSRNGISHFHVACMTNNVRAAEFFLRADIPVDQAVNGNSDEWPDHLPIHFMTKYRSVEMYGFLTDNTMNTPLSKEWMGYTPLHFAVKYSCLDIVKLLLKNGADHRLQNYKGMTPLHILIKRIVELVDFKKMSKTEFKAIHENELQIKALIMNILIGYDNKNGDNFRDVGLTPLHLACIQIDQLKLSNLLRVNPDVDACVNSNSPIFPGYTSLHFAAHFDLELVKLLLKAGASLRVKNMDGLTPMDLCVMRYSERELNDLLSGNDYELPLSTRVLLRFNVPDIIYDKFETENPLDANGISHFHIACAAGYRDLVKMYMEHGVDVNEVTKCSFKVKITTLRNRIISNYVTIRKGSTATHIAVLCGRIRIVELLLTGDVDLNIQDTCGFTPIHLALSVRDSLHFTTIVDSMMKASIRSKKLRNLTSINNLSHLHVLSSSEDDLKIEELLKQNVDVNAQIITTEEWPEELAYLWTVEGCTPLHIAIRKSNAISVEKLIEYGADVYKKDAEGNAPLDHANLHLIMNALKRNRRPLGAMGMTSLHMASLSFDKAMITELLRNGEDVNARIRATDSDSPWDGLTPSHILFKIRKDLRKMFKNRDIEQYENFEEYFADIFNVLQDYDLSITARNSLNATPLHFAVSESQDPMNFSVDRTLVRVAFDVLDRSLCIENPVDRNNFSHFHLACCFGDDEMVRLFLQMGADINLTVDPYSYGDNVFPMFNSIFRGGYTPLHFAIANFNMDAVEVLLKHGADLTIEDSDGNTPLHLIAGFCSMPENTVQRMLSLGANLNARNLVGQTPLEVALRRSDEESRIFEYSQLFIAFGSRVNMLNPINEEGMIGLFMQNPILWYKDPCPELRFLTVNDDEDFGPPAARYSARPLDYPVTEPLGPLEIIARACDIRSIDENGWNAFHNLASVNITHDTLPPFRYVQAIEHFAAIGCDLNHRDKRGRTALHIAVEIEESVILKSLLTSGADINEHDNAGNSPADYCLPSNSNGELFEVIMNHMWRLVSCKMLLSDRNKIFFSKFEHKYPIDIGVLRKISLELEEMKNLHVSSRMIAERFLSEIGYNMYLKMSKEEQDVIGRFFAYPSEIRRKFPELGSLLIMQYRRAAYRIKLLDPAIEAMAFVDYRLPDLIVKMILRQLENEDLKNIVEATMKKRNP